MTKKVKIDGFGDRTTILTKYLPATNRRGARIKADAGLRRTITVPYDYAANCPHDVAALALCEKFEWTGTLNKGGMETGYAYVFKETRE